MPPAASPLTVARPETAREKRSVAEPSVWEWVFLLPLLGALAFSPWFYGLFRFRDQLAAETVIAALFIVSFPWIKWKRAFRPTTSEGDLWVGLGAGIGLVSVFFSTLPYPSLLSFFKLASLILFYILVRNFVTTRLRLRVFIWTIVAAGVFYAAYGLAQYRDVFPHAYWSQPFDLASRFVNGGHFATFLLFPLWVGVSLCFASRNRVAKLLWAASLGVMGWALLLTRSRTGWGVLVIGFLVFGWQASRAKAKEGNSRNFSFLLLAGLAGAAFLFFKVGGLEIFSQRTQELWQNKFYSLTNRVDLWRGSWAAIQARPWGWGIGTFGWVFPPFKVQTDRFVVDYAHNEFLQTGVDLGIPGMLLLGGFLFFYSLRLFSLARRPDLSPFRKWLGAGFAALFVSLMVTSQLDYPLRVYTNGLYFAAFLALSTSLSESPVRRGPSASNRGWGWFVFLFALPMLVLTGRQLLAETYFQDAQTFDQGFRWNEALEKYSEAVRLVPFYGQYQEGLANLYFRKASLSFKKTEKAQFREAALQAYQEAVRAFPYNARTHHLLGLLLEERGDLAGAKFHLREATRLDPKSAFFLSGYANLAYRHSWVREALTAYEKMLGLPFWEEGGETVCSVLKKSYQLSKDYPTVRGMAPNNEEGHFCLGTALGEAGQWEWAQKEFDQALEHAERFSAEAARLLKERIHSFYISRNLSDERYGPAPRSS